MARDGDLGLAEVGAGHNFGAVQLNVAFGQTWGKQNSSRHCRAKNDGSYLLAEALIPVAGKVWATVGGTAQWGTSDLRRGYQNAGLPDQSKGTPDLKSWSLRARLDWQDAFRVVGTAFAPYVDLSYTEARLDAYRETGGGFQARFDARTEKSTDLRLGINAIKPVSDDVQLVGLLEGTHRFEKSGAATSGELIGLFGFRLAGDDNKRGWLRASVGVQGKLGGGKASLTINATTQGEAPTMWMAANWQMAF